jgi:hypothetical protein
MDGCRSVTLFVVNHADHLLLKQNFSLKAGFLFVVDPTNFLLLDRDLLAEARNSIIVDPADYLPLLCIIGHLNFSARHFNLLS